MDFSSFPSKEGLLKDVQDLSQPIAKRMRAIFYLKAYGGDDSVAALCGAMRNKEGTTLFRHELAYVLGQMQNKAAIADLLAVLADTEDDPIVRHEAGEALGAIAAPETLPELDRFSADPRPEVSETCQIAARRVRWMMEKGEAAADEGHAKENPFHSVDPAPAERAPKAKEDVAEMQRKLMDKSLPLFERYRAMFSLRNGNNKASVLALCTGLQDDSPLFRHEVAYVLGQLANPHSMKALQAAVLDPAEHEMVRHEAAEALGAIGTGECLEFLEKYAHDSERTVMLRESCQVAIDAADYYATWTSSSASGEGAAAAAEGGSAAAGAGSA